MTNSPFYAAFERMWEHILNKFDNYVKIENLDELSATFELITIEDIDNICGTNIQLITFTISSSSHGSNSFQAEQGMTWAEWVNSSYNTSHIISGDRIGIPGSYATVSFNSISVRQSDVIVANREYWYIIDNGSSD